MTDLMAKSGHMVDAAALEQKLGVPVVVVLADKGEGLDALRRALERLPQTAPPAARDWMLPTDAEAEVAELAGLLHTHHGLSARQSGAEAVGLLMQPVLRPEEEGRWAPDVLTHLGRDRENFARLGIDFPSLMIEARYAWAQRVTGAALPAPKGPALPRKVSGTDKVDRIVMHPCGAMSCFSASWR